ncbi:hypothetical protein [Bifidobacterium pseudocatenulatum]|uniref:hypothetical protein n=1 Tax=Bifidobacterium pseudocatenulatum TaxID=28026 RepID=UPI0018A90BF3|nr:hypothetical protein [Bifidobacterium pseudocatenulatum]
MQTATIIFNTGGSGGLGKSFNARALAQTLGLHGYVTLLIDGNHGQQSQRAFLKVDRMRGLEDYLERGMDAVVRPGEIHTAFGFLPGPADPKAPDIIDMYGRALTDLMRRCAFIVVDCDRIDGTQWENPNTMAGGLMRPLVESGGARIAFRMGQTGSQTDDGLDALASINRPDRTLVIGQAAAGTKPHGDAEWRGLLRGLAEYAGTDVWDGTGADLIERRQPGYAKGMEPDWLKAEATWCGADPARWKNTERKRGWPWTRRRG